MIHISFYTEESYEKSLIELFQNLGYRYFYGPDIERDYKNPLYMDDLEIIYRINNQLDVEAVDKAIEIIQDLGIGSLEDKNNKFMNYLQNGINVNYWKNGKEKTTHVKLIDYIGGNNNFTVINQWTVVDKETKIPDIVVFINGFPLVVCELKSPSRENTDTSEAYRQLKKYMQVIPVLFNYNAFCVMSDMSISKAGTITASEDRFMEWKTIDGSYESTQFADFTTFFEGIFDKKRFIDILKNFIVFSNDSTTKIKILVAYVNIDSLG